MTKRLTRPVTRPLVELVSFVSVGDGVMDGQSSYEVKGKIHKKIHLKQANVSVAADKV